MGFGPHTRPCSKLPSRVEQRADYCLLLVARACNWEASTGARRASACLVVGGFLFCGEGMRFGVWMLVSSLGIVNFGGGGTHAPTVFVSFQKAASPNPPQSVTKEISTPRFHAQVARHMASVQIITKSRFLRTESVQTLLAALGLVSQHSDSLLPVSKRGST
ncbi:hypothetical protein HDK77DRAFT_46773 [Phyllosticta capitalensis]|uniref:Uncharacterized protein n=1 Tax=Phyllosticta capitalensis TaxID=121624 RepID=A0ABR1YAG2_9PEZI